MTSLTTIWIVAVILRKDFVMSALCGLSFLSVIGVEIGRPDMDDIVIARQSCVAGCTCLLCLAWQERCRLTAEIQRLQAQVRSQALELLVAHSEALGIYDLTTLPKKEAT
jgi:hypothetical protein